VELILNGKERMIHAFCHKEADMVPVGEAVIDSHVACKVLGKDAWVGGGGYIRKIRDYMIHDGNRNEFVDKYKEDTVEFFSKLDVDFMCADLMPPINCNTRLESINEKRWRIIDDNLGIWSEYAYESKADYTTEIDSNFKQYDGYGDVERYLEIFENDMKRPDKGIFDSIRYCKEKLGKEKFILTHFPQLYPHGSSWYTKFLMLMMEEPELAKRLFDLYLKKALLYVEEYGKIGVDGLFIGGDWAGNSGPLYSPEMIKKYLVPQIRAVCDLAHEYNIKVIKHTDGNIMKIADEFFGMGIDAYQSIDPFAGMELKTVKELYGNRIVFFGNVDCGRTLVKGTREEIIEEVKRCLLDGANGGGYVLTSSNTITKMIPADNYLIMLEAARKFGKLPLNL
jgi:hypothetical protein